MTSLPRRKRGPVRAVQRSVPGSDVVSAVPPQKKTFNNSHNLAKPLIFDPKDPKCKMGYVPLKSEQLFSRPDGAGVFNGPELLILEKLNVPSNDFYNTLFERTGRVKSRWCLARQSHSSGFASACFRFNSITSAWFICYSAQYFYWIE